MLKIEPGKDRALIYLRHSPKPEEKRTLDSLDAQREACERYAQYAGLKIVHVMEQPFVSASKVAFMKRGGEQIIELSRRAAIRHVIAQRVDRLFRNTVDGLTSMQALRRAKVDLHFADEGGSTLNCSTATGEFLFTMRLANAAYEPGLIRERTSDAMTRRIFHMMSNTKSPPYGCKLGNDGIPEKGSKNGKRCWVLEYCETEVRNLQLMHKWIEQDGMTYVEAAECLNSYARSTKDKTYLRRHGGEWTGPFLSRMYCRAKRRAAWFPMMSMLVDNPEPLDDSLRQPGVVRYASDSDADSDNEEVVVIDDGGDDDPEATDSSSSMIDFA